MSSHDLLTRLGDGCTLTAQEVTSMSTQFFGRTHEGQVSEQPSGVRFFGGHARGTVFRFTQFAGEGFAASFVTEHGQEFTAREFAEAVRECNEVEWERS